jgi:glycosyltransferase involved in cell wall biosynthesis
MYSRPKISVNIITFNHAQFIAQTLDSVLMQKVPFDIEIIVGDDCSTDGTTDIVKDYHRRWPETIKPVLRPKNVGAGRNARETLQMCQGQYIACVEGDDYWTDSNKLRLQAEFLDRHSGCALVHHKVEHVTWPDGKVLGEFPPAQYRAEKGDARALAKLNFVQACSIMLRREWLPPLDEQFEQLKLGDWPLCVLLSQRGWIGHLDRTMAHYRVHPNNTWNNRPADYKLKAMEEMAWYLLDRIGGPAKDAWKETLLALAFKDFALAAKSFALGKAVRKLSYFMRRSCDFNKPFWLLTGLWPYYQANYLGKSVR